MTYEPGDMIPIRVGKMVVHTVIDDHGVQRLPMNKIYAAWVDGTTQASDSYNRKTPFSNRDADVTFNLNDMCVLYQQGEFTDEEWLDFYLHIGYSVDGFSSLSDFEDLEIINPAWGDSIEDVYKVVD